MPRQARKYTDTDVRLHPELRQQAVAYAVEYGGDFDYMLQAQATALATGDLRPGVVRGVLNCMRTDPAVASNLAYQPADDEDETATGATVTPLRRTRRHSRITKEHRDRPTVLRMRTRVKMSYGMARNGTVLHVPKPAAIITWRNARMGDWHDWIWLPAPEIQRLSVVWLCGARTDHPVLLPAFDPEEDRPCRACFAEAETAAPREVLG